jgi:hypothetical protein
VAIAWTGPLQSSAEEHGRVCRLPLGGRTARAGEAEAGSVQTTVGRNTSRGARKQAPGYLANEKWLTARQSASMRERQRLYLQYVPYCPRRRKTIVPSNVLRHCVSTGEVSLKAAFPHHTRVIE